MALGPPQDKQDWRDSTLLNLANQQEVLMSSIEDLKAAAAANRQEVVGLRQDQQATKAQVTALTGSVDTLITLVGELRTNLSPEEQALVDESMAEVAATLQEATAARSEEGVERSTLAALQSRAAAAAGGNTPPAPPSP
jgi:hypothetical protein